MNARRSHYELAFEAYLAARGTPCVAIEDVKHFAKRRIGTKVFDYIVYPPGSRACLVDVKGRKSAMQASKSDCRQKNWVTRADIEGLEEWQRIFGEDFSAQFVFAYWLTASGRGAPEHDLTGPDGDTFKFAGRRYSFWIVPLGDYLRYQKRLSKSWDTVSIPRDDFRRISRRLGTLWPAAPC
jgi:hypothetical protein